MKGFTGVEWQPWPSLILFRGWFCAVSAEEEAKMAAGPDLVMRTDLFYTDKGPMRMYIGNYPGRDALLQLVRVRSGTAAAEGAREATGEAYDRGHREEATVGGIGRRVGRGEERGDRESHVCGSLWVLCVCMYVC